MTNLSIDLLDPTGDIRTIADDAGAYDPLGTRREMLKRAGFAGVGLAAGGTLLGAFMGPVEAMAASGAIDWTNASPARTTSRSATTRSRSSTSRRPSTTKLWPMAS